MTAETNATTIPPYDRAKYFMPWPPADPELAVCANFVLRSEVAVSCALFFTCKPRFRIFMTCHEQMC